MFDVGSLELFVIMIIALMVIGPKRMPEVARKIGQFLGKSKRFINSMKEDSEFSSAIKEMKESINLEEEKRHIEEMRGNLANDFEETKQDASLDEEFSRPSFGGKAVDDNTASQFNKAPSQPQIPKPTTPPPSKDSPAEPTAVTDSEPAIPKKTETPSETKSS